MKIIFDQFPNDFSRGNKKDWLRFAVSLLAPPLFAQRDIISSESILFGLGRWALDFELTFLKSLLTSPNF
jgi:hypothetical protein